MAYAIDRLQRVELGRCGENLARRVAIDASTWLGRWPGARLEVLCHRPTESTLYIPETLLDGAVLLWTVTAADTAFPGTGRGEVRAILGDVVVKSAVFDTVITPALEGTAGDPPAAGVDWATDVIQAADRAEAASKQAVDAKLDAEAAAEQAEENVRTALQEAKDSGEFDGAPGTSGVYLGKEAPTDETVNVWIDPEGDAYYPIATRETLGGVKVGDGLTVDETGVLGVKPEGVYELIETIVLDEDMTIERTQEPDGTPYSFDSMWVHIKKPKDTTMPSGSILFFKTDGISSNKHFVHRWMDTNNSPEERTLLLRVDNIKGEYLPNFPTEWSIDGGSPLLRSTARMDTSILTADKPIGMVKTTINFPAGTVITIKGVRA